MLWQGKSPASWRRRRHPFGRHVRSGTAKAGARTAPMRYSIGSRVKVPVRRGIHGFCSRRGLEWRWPRRDRSPSRRQDPHRFHRGQSGNLRASAAPAARSGRPGRSTPLQIMSPAKCARQPGPAAWGWSTSWYDNRDHADAGEGARRWQNRKSSEAPFAKAPSPSVRSASHIANQACEGGGRKSEKKSQASISRRPMR